MAEQTLADVYEDLLPAVWRYVSARVPERADAEDVTSEVFTRALESWRRYEPSRGSAIAWISGIARHVVLERWRDRRFGSRWLDNPQIAGGADPSESAADAERLYELRHALAELNERERDAIALRFAAGLRHGEIAEILGSSTGAVKMTIFRTLMKLRAALAREVPASTDDDVMATSLDEAISAVIARRRASIPDPLLARVVQLLAVAHRPDVPDRVTTRVQACVACDALTTGAESSRLRIGPFALPSVAKTIRALTAPACAVCATAPILQLPLTALGLWGAATVLHAALAVLAPLNVVLLWRSFRRHSQTTALALAVVGVGLILAHLTGHLFGLRMDPAQSTFWEMATGIWAGATLLGAATFVDRHVARPVRATVASASLDMQAR